MRCGLLNQERRDERASLEGVIAEKNRKANELESQLRYQQPPTKEELAKVLGTEGEDWTISAKETNPWVVTVDGKEYPLSERGTTGGGQQGGGEENPTELTNLVCELISK